MGLAKRASAKADEAIRARRIAVRFASESGASLRDIANATGPGHMTLKRILERSEE